ncbi:MAG: hypothetical protein NC039_05145 [Muribaculaceae bacterium]|nr:hypothetical protein [Muribaculaceae bacterium]
MRRLHLFNPENDLALGLGCRYYTPPPHAAALHRAGALLPAWWAVDGDFIVAPAELADDLEYLRIRFGLKGDVLQRGVDLKGLTPSPWGWSADAVRQFVKAGVLSESLPDDESISRIRQLSHRRSSVKILEMMGRDDVLTVETDDPDMAVRMESEYPGCFIKSPWSGSGRGVFCAGGLPPEVIRGKAEGIIHRQGSVMVERGLDKVADCAALFYASDGIVALRGLSMFQTEHRGMYGGNIVAPQTWIRSRLEEYVGAETLDRTLAGLVDALNRLIGKDYEGWLGVDMMVWRDIDGHLRLHPCIELNLRMTMGVVAMAVSERLDVRSPHLMAWHRGESDLHLTLLPSHEGFSLTLLSYDRL